MVLRLSLAILIALLTRPAYSQATCPEIVDDDELLWNATVRLCDGSEISAETAQLYRAYRGGLGRAPDPGGFAWWRARLQSGEHTLDSMLAGFISSEEFLRRMDVSQVAEIDSVAFLEYLYRNVLGREPDAGGFRWWRDQIDSGRKSLAQVLRGFTQSNEFVEASLGQMVAYLPTAGGEVRLPGLLIAPEDGAALASLVSRSLPASTLRLDLAAPIDDALAPAPSLDGGSGRFSSTYRLEADVDEHDIVKYDGDLMVIAPSRSACCFILEPALADVALPAPPETGPKAIRLLAADPASAQARTVGRIELEGDESVEGVYLNGAELIALSSTAWWGVHGDRFDAIMPWTQQQTAVSIFDIDNPAAPTRGWRIELEGALVASRRVGDQLLLISRHFPDILGLNLFPRNAGDIAANMAALEGLGAEELLPDIVINGEPAADILTAGDCLVTNPDHPKAPDNSGDAIITTLLSIDLSSRQVDDARCYSDRADGVYVTATSVYVAHGVGDADGGQDTIVHRFSHGSSIDYRGSGRVPGTLLGRGQADFRMSEQGDLLRMVTTVVTRDEADRFDHRLFILEQDPSLPELRELASLPNESQPAEIGKPNEDLYGVRFLGDRVYLVTFERIDPLYVIDVSDATQPSVLGELEIPGFSDLLHPVNDALLLGLGDDGAGHVKVELFDVSAPTDPRSLAAITLAEDAAWSWSEARYDRRAFTYLAGTGIDRAAVPVSGGFADPMTDQYRSLQRLYLLEVSGKDDPDSASLRGVGVLAVDEQPTGESRYRSIIDGDAVYFLTGDRVWSTFWSDPGQRFGPF